MSASQEVSTGQDQDSADLAKFGYKQELKRSLGTFSSFAVTGQNIVQNQLQSSVIRIKFRN